MVASPSAWAKAMDFTVPSKYSLTLNMGISSDKGQKEAASMPKAPVTVTPQASESYSARQDQRQ
jgi:hypothetical protein